MDVSLALTARLAERPIERVIAPNAFIAAALAEPSAAQIRQWAYNAAVDVVVVGHVKATPIPQHKGRQKLEVEAIVRSGHSGAEVARHRVALDGAADIEASAEALAAAILGDLGYRDADAETAGPARDPRSPEPPRFVTQEAPGPVGAEPAAITDLSDAVRDDDAPIHIDADEAEIIDRGAGRRLVFQRNVRVRQGDVSLESESLEAEYRKGESEPDRLVARGSVRVDQGHRRAKCDRAVYERAEQRLSCEGRAELVQGCDIVRGDSIEFDFAGERARVKGAASIVIRPSESDDGQAADCPTGEGVL